MRVFRAAKKSVVTVVGFAFVALGIVLIPLPGPGLLVSVVGFAILATEYAWARRALDTTKAKAIEGQRQVAKSKLTYVGQLLFAVGMVCIAVAMIVWHDYLPFASPVASSMLIVGAAILATSAVMARRRYANPQL